VAGALSRYGFSEATLQEGWRKLGGLINGRLLLRAPKKEAPLLVRRLADWENQWFPIASATLRGRYPEVHEHLFGKLERTEGVVSVGTFVDRVDQLATEPALPQGAAARELLAKRGLIGENLEVARDLLQAVHSVAAAEDATEVDPVARQAVEKALWDWYLEWGEIARAVIKDRRLLRELGFLSTKRAASATPAPDAQEHAELPRAQRGGSAA
jgi:hypothetical protein